MKRADIEANTIFLTQSGSRAYGLATPESDQDFKGVFYPAPDYVYGFKTIEQKDKGWDDLSDPASGLIPCLETPEVDAVIYDVRKYLQLALNNNPNILEMLFQPESTHVICDDYVKANLLSNRSWFLSKKVRYSLSGYAYAQIRKIEQHRKWLLDPPTAPPKLEDFGLSEEYSPLTKEEVNAFLEFLYILIKDRVEWLDTSETMKDLLKSVDFKGVLTHSLIPQEVLDYLQTITRTSKEFVTLLHQTQLYRSEQNKWKSYQDWKVNRNPKRKAMEVKCGFDAKFASQAIRLLRMGAEALEHHTLFVDRTNIDREELLAIKQGNVSYEYVSELADSLFAELDGAYENSTLQYAPQFDKINELCVDLVSYYLSK